MQPEFGTDLKKSVFEFNNELLEDKIDSDIKKAVKFWLPYVRIEEIKHARYEHTFEIYVQFSIEGDRFTKESITLVIENQE